MQRKIKISIYTLLFAAILSVFAALLFVMPHSVSSVYAATNTSAVCTVKGRFEANNGQVIATTVKPESHFSITMESTNANGAGTLEYGTVINWANIIIKLNVVGGVKHLRFAITNAQDNIDVLANPLSGGGSLELFRGALSDGDYVLYYSSTITEGRNEYRGFIYRYRFTVDTTAPTNISKSDNVQINSGIQTTKSITYSATDEHLSRLYYKSPSASYFSSTTNSQYIVEPTKNNSGTWNFYAVDSVGNKSETVQVHLDCVPPAMTIANGMSFGTTVGDNITVTAYDNISSAKLYVKFESEEWFSTGSSYTIPNTERNGRYYFYAEDGNGNRTETSWIVLSTEEPAGSLIKSDTDNSISFVWNNEYWSATLDGSNYTEGRLISNEGQHEIVLSNNAYKTKKYAFKIEHCYKVVEKTAATCFENGTIKYECSQCGDTYEETEYANGHKYVISSTPSTCTECEHVTYTCSLCGEKYEKEGNYPTGHSYIETVTVEPTCTTDGERKAVCEFCGDEYTTKINASGHTYEITDTSTKDGKTTRTYTCKDCGESYKQELGNQYEDVSNYVEYLFEQYSPYMWWVLLASAGVWSIAIGVMTAIAQKNEDKEKAKKMLINYVIGLVVIAVIVVACPYLIRGIAALIT